MIRYIILKFYLFSKKKLYVLIETNNKSNLGKNNRKIKICYFY